MHKSEDGVWIVGGCVTCMWRLSFACLFVYGIIRNLFCFCGVAERRGLCCYVCFSNNQQKQGHRMVQPVCHVRMYVLRVRDEQWMQALKPNKPTGLARILSAGAAIPAASGVWQGCLHPAPENFRHGALPQSVVRDAPRARLRGCVSGATHRPYSILTHGIPHVKVLN